MAKRDGFVGKALARLEEAADVVVVPRAEHALHEAVYDDYRVLNRQLEDIGWSVLDYIGGQPSELSQQSRRRIVQRARYVWMNDPQAGAAVELMNDFCFGRGVPRPRAKDKKVQEWIDKAWDDPDNQEVLTTIDAQQALGTDLALQSNIFLLMFDEGDDGMVKLSILRHDDVTDAIPDPDKRHRLLWYVCAQPRRQTWNFKLNQWSTQMITTDSVKPVYYPHWRNVELALEEQGRETPLDTPDDSQLGEGKVYHVRINRYSEQRFGTPRFQRTMRWYSAYNQFVKDRLDVVSGAAAMIMKRKIKGSPQQLARDASKALSRRSVLSSGQAPTDPQSGAPAWQMPPRAGGIMVENESVDHEPLRIDTGAGNAQQDANIIRAPISAAERFPQSYFGDATNSNLATATSLELPVLKAVETRQEAFEQIFRWFIDRVIERGVETGNIDEDLDPSEVETPVDARDMYDGNDPFRNDPNGTLQQALEETAQQEYELGHAVVELARVFVSGDRTTMVPLMVTRSFDGRYHYRLVEYEDQVQDEQDTKRDLGYEFSMPSPLRRMMGDLITAITQIAQTFDPNNTNPNLSRALLTIALGEGFEVQDAPDLVDQIIPKGYVDPMVKAQLDAAKAGMMPQVGPDGQPLNPDGSSTNPNADNPYGGPMDSTMPEDQRSGAYNAVEATFDERGRCYGMWASNRRGERVFYPMQPRHMLEASTHHGVLLPATVTRPTNAVVDEATEATARGDIADAQTHFQSEVIDVGLDALDDARLTKE